MRKGTCILFFFLYAVLCSGQTGFPFYYEYVKYATCADSLYTSGQFYLSAVFYSKAIGIKVEKGIPISYAELHYNAACSWSLAGYADSAYSHLNASVGLGYSDLNNLMNDSDLVRLHTDKRWENIKTGITSNIRRSEKIKAIYEERTCFDKNKNEIVFLPLDEKVKQLLLTDTLPFISVNHENTRVYFRGNSYTSEHFTELKQLLSSAYTKVLSVLDIPFYNKGINIVIVNSREELKEVTGIAAYGGFAMVGANTVFLAFNEKRRLQAKHEIFHLVSQDVWGTTYSRLLDEGGGVFADNECYCENPIYGINAYFQKNNLLLPFESLINDFNNMAFNNDVIAYLESSGIFKYLYEEYGVAKLKQLRIMGFDKFEIIYGLPLLQMEKDWRSMISTIPVPTGIDWTKLLNEGCG